MLHKFEIKKGGGGGGSRTFLSFYMNNYGCHGNQMLKLGTIFKHLLLRNYCANISKNSQNCSLDSPLLYSIILLLFSMNTLCCHDNQYLKLAKTIFYQIVGFWLLWQPELSKEAYNLQDSERGLLKEHFCQIRQKLAQYC